MHFCECIERLTELVVHLFDELVFSEQGVITKMGTGAFEIRHFIQNLANRLV